MVALRKFYSGLLPRVGIAEPRKGSLGTRMGRITNRLVVLTAIYSTGATNTYKSDQLCAGLKAGIFRAVHGVQSIWDNNLYTTFWVYLLVDAKTRSTI